jgi:hypothetical protein
MEAAIYQITRRHFCITTAVGFMLYQVVHTEDMIEGTSCLE